MTNRILISLALAGALAGCGETVQPRLASSQSGCATEASAGYWLHDVAGEKIGSIRRLMDSGRSASIMVGSYFEPGSHTAVVPVCEIRVSKNGEATLRSETVEALNAHPLR